jgi:hypothetical protein
MKGFVLAFGVIALALVSQTDRSGESVLPPYGFAELSATAADGSEVYCYDCQVATLDGGGQDWVVASATCVAGGTGAIAWMINGTWKCSYTP